MNQKVNKSTIIGIIEWVVIIILLGIGLINIKNNLFTSLICVAAILYVAFLMQFCKGNVLLLGDKLRNVFLCPVIGNIVLTLAVVYKINDCELDILEGMQTVLGAAMFWFGIYNIIKFAILNITFTAKKSLVRTTAVVKIEDKFNDGFFTDGNITPYVYYYDYNGNHYAMRKDLGRVSDGEKVDIVLMKNHPEVIYKGHSTGYYILMNIIGLALIVAGCIVLATM